MQVKGGRVLVHENPAHAKPGSLPEIRKMMRRAGVDVFEADQCMYGLSTWGKPRSQAVLANTPFQFMTKSRSIWRELRRSCDAPRDHQPLIDGRAKPAARYPLALCRALCRGNQGEDAKSLRCEIVGGSSGKRAPEEAKPGAEPRGGGALI